MLSVDGQSAVDARALKCVARRAVGSVTGCSGRSVEGDDSVAAQHCFSLHELFIILHTARGQVTGCISIA